MKKIGITGYRGYVGSYLLENYPNFVGLECDVTNPEQVENCITDSKIDVVLHLAAKSNIDFCEKLENTSLVGGINFGGTVNVCRSAEKANIGFVLLSSDHVFSGAWGSYKENSKPFPVNYYGMSKLAAEAFVLSQSPSSKIVRTSYLFDSTRLRPKIDKLLNREAELYPTFITRTFMHRTNFANSLVYYLDNFEKMPKLLHISGNTSTSWYGFMLDMAKNLNIPNYKKLIIPRRNQSQIMAPRPFHAGLNVRLSKRLGLPQFSYRDGL